MHFCPKKALKKPSVGGKIFFVKKKKIYTPRKGRFYEK